MKKVVLLIVVLNLLIFSNSADKALSLFEQGKYDEALAIAFSLDESSAKNLYVKAITEKVGNEAASLYRKALAADDITSDLSRSIYQRLAGYYDAIGIPGSVSVMLDRATMTVTTTTASDIESKTEKKDSVDNMIVKKDTVINISKNDIKLVEANKKIEDTLDFASVEEVKEKIIKPQAAVAKKVDVSEPPKVFYTLQTGAFGLEANALKMKSRLETSFKNVSVIKQRSGDRTLHKVRVGKFTNQQEALSFATAKLRPKKIKFRIVKE